MNGWTITKIWLVNNKLVIADNIEDAICLYRDYCSKGYDNAVLPDIEKVEAVANNSILKDYDAIIKEE